jgi:hypothetical protein
MRLPAGSRHIDGHPVGFPYSDTGAAAAQVAMVEAQLGFDYQQATALAGLYASPADAATFQHRARTTVEQRRRQAAVPVDGAHIAAPASYAMTPIAFSVDQLAPDYYAVHVLSYVTLTSTGGRSGDHLYVGTQLMRWVEGDWKAVQGSPEDLEHLQAHPGPGIAEPGTPAYQRARWITIRKETP